MRRILVVLLNLALLAVAPAIAQTIPQEGKKTESNGHQTNPHSPAQHNTNTPNHTSQPHPTGQHPQNTQPTQPAPTHHAPSNTQHAEGHNQPQGQNGTGTHEHKPIEEEHSGLHKSTTPAAGVNAQQHSPLDNQKQVHTQPEQSKPNTIQALPVQHQNSTQTHKPAATTPANNPAGSQHPAVKNGTTPANTPAGQHKSAETGTGTHNVVAKPGQEKPATPVVLHPTGGTRKDEVEEFAKYSSFDFIPGENVVFYDDFSNDSLGGFPRKWHTYGSGKIITAYKPNQRWFKLNPASAYIPEVANNLPDAYSIQFDIIVNAPANVKNPKGTVSFSILSSEGGNGLEGDGNAGGTVAMHISKSGISTFNAKTWNIFARQDVVDVQVQNDALNGKLGKPIQVSIMVFKQKFSMYLDDKKVFDIPRFVPAGILFDKFRIVLDDQESWEFLVSNFRFATHIPKIKNILQYDGKLVTRGLQFEYGAAGLKPISYGTIKEIASVLKANPDWRVKIIGHTDDSGDDQINLQLSKNRAEMVKTYLVKYFQLNPMRFATEGLGETMPISDNKTAEGRANNRRVEFVRF